MVTFRPVLPNRRLGRSYPNRSESIRELHPLVQGSGTMIAVVKPAIFFKKSLLFFIGLDFKIFPEYTED
jgi:hypothetical protein